MANIRTSADRTGKASGERDDARARARAAFSASVQAIVAEKQAFAKLSELGDLEMMEAATELTRKR